MDESQCVDAIVGAAGDTILHASSEIGCALLLCLLYDLLDAVLQVLDLIGGILLNECHLFLQLLLKLSILRVLRFDANSQLFDSDLLGLCLLFDLLFSSDAILDEGLLLCLR